MCTGSRGCSCVSLGSNIKHKPLPFKKKIKRRKNGGFCEHKNYTLYKNKTYRIENSLNSSKMKISNSGFIALIVSILHVVKASNEISLDTDRNLQTICSISATAKCTIVSAGVSCDMFRIYAHKCRTETVEMTYEWCNKNPDQVVQLDRSTTKIDLNNVPFSMNKRDIPANTCRKHIRRRDLDLCDPNNAQIFASITINGWSNPTQIGYTCYAHQYIQTRIVYPSPITLAPTSSATEKVTS